LHGIEIICIFDNINNLKSKKMGIVKEFVKIIKSGYPDFNEKTDYVEIEFEGGGDSFGSFHSISISRPGDWNYKFEGDIDLDEHMDLLFEILDVAEVEYNWNNAGTNGYIKYNEDDDQSIAVNTIVSSESWGSIDNDEDEDEDEE
jgi:hypothetical protein